MNVWRSTAGDHHWTNGTWGDRSFEDGTADIVHRNYDDIRRIGVIRIKSIKEKQA